MEAYAIVIHQEPEGGFWAEVPALQGCYSQGETEGELIENVREAIEGVVDVMKTNGTNPGVEYWILELDVLKPSAGSGESGMVS